MSGETVALMRDGLGPWTYQVCARLARAAAARVYHLDSYKAAVACSIRGAVDLQGACKHKGSDASKVQILHRSPSNAPRRMSRCQ